ncbi:MAG: hypothetical protein HRU01_22955 [Myxococcales bacterium]|nr:hypothetical protein [Myxococcales bacterium]
MRLLSLPWGVACAGIAFNASAAPMFMGLGDLPGGVFQSRVADVSVDGSVAVGYGRVGSGFGEAFRWNQAEEMVGLGTLTGANSSESRGVSTDGSVIVGVSSSTAWRWTEAGGMIDLGLPESGASNTVSADGSVIVGRSASEAFRWTSSAGVTLLGDLGGGSSRANAVSADGSVAAGMAVSAFGEEAFRWTAAGGMVGLGDLAGGIFSSEAFGVSAGGSVVVGKSNSAY